MTDRAEIARRARELYDDMTCRSYSEDSDVEKIEAALLAERDAALAEVQAEVTAVRRALGNPNDRAVVAEAAALDWVTRMIDDMREALKTGGG